jgi:hypothetical protein
LAAELDVPMIGLAPSTRATWIAATPTPEDAALIRTDSPAWSPALVVRASWAVTKTLGIDAACSQLKPSGIGIAAR